MGLKQKCSPPLSRDFYAKKLSGGFADEVSSSEPAFNNFRSLQLGAEANSYEPENMKRHAAGGKYTSKSKPYVSPSSRLGQFSGASTENKENDPRAANQQPSQAPDQLLQRMRKNIKNNTAYIKNA